MSLSLASCARDVNLAQDVDLLMPSPTSKVLGYTNTQSNTQTNTPPPPVQAPKPTPVITPIPTTKPTEAATVSAKPQENFVELATSKGTIRLKLYPDKAPKTVANFLNKGKTGYYANLTFHRVEDWVIQGGDPLGNGTGGGTMPTELNDVPFKAGSLGVARGGDIKISNDSQFFICTTDCTWLTGQYTNFGEVVGGMEIAAQIAIGDKILSITEVK